MKEDVEAIKGNLSEIRSKIAGIFEPLYINLVQKLKRIKELEEENTELKKLLSIQKIPMVSKRFDFNIADYQAWVKNALWFTAPVILIYLVSVMSVVTEPGHTMKLVDFAVSEMTKTAIVVWILNRAVDFFRRYQSGK